MAVDASTTRVRAGLGGATVPLKTEPASADPARVRKAYVSVANGNSGAKLAHVLDLDPDLGAGLRAEDQEAARWACRGRVVKLPRGNWDYPELAGERDDLLGMVITDGLLCREVSLRDRYLFELLGPGDVLALPIVVDRPRLGGQIKITAVNKTKAVLLGESFIRAAGRWPSLLTAVHRRLETQREHLAIQGLIAHLPRAEHRLLLQLWHLADRWGRMTSEGTLLPLPFTHDLLGQLSASRRSTATLALRTLECEGCIRRVRGGSWLLTHTAEQRIRTIAEPHNGGLIGETLELRHSIAQARENTHALRAQADRLRGRNGGSGPGGRNGSGPGGAQLRPKEIVATDEQIERQAVL